LLQSLAKRCAPELIIPGNRLWNVGETRAHRQNPLEMQTKHYPPQILCGRMWIVHPPFYLKNYLQNSKNDAKLKKVQPRFSPRLGKNDGKIILTLNFGIILY
jgi:hypothetical protein